MGWASHAARRNGKRCGIQVEEKVGIFRIGHKMAYFTQNKGSLYHKKLVSNLV